MTKYQKCGCGELLTIAMSIPRHGCTSAATLRDIEVFTGEIPLSQSKGKTDHDVRTEKRVLWVGMCQKGAK